MLPGFKLQDAYASSEMTVRDLLVHRSGLGLGAGDLLFYPPPSDRTRAEIVHSLRYIKPASSFRSTLRAPELRRGHHLHGLGYLLRRLDARDAIAQVFQRRHGV